MMIEIRTGVFQWDIDGRGRTQSFRDLRTGTECSATSSVPLASLRRDGEAILPEEAMFRDNVLAIVFADGSRVSIRLERSHAYLLLTIADVDAAPFDRLDFLDVPLALEPSADPEAFCACAVARNLQTRVDAIPGPQSRLSASCYPELGVVGAGVAIVAGRFCELRKVLKQMVSEAEELPHSPLGGPWALDAPENRNSYLFSAPSVETVDEWIGLCQDLGIAQLHFSGGTFRHGDFDPNPNMFPNGYASVREVVDKIHAAGLQAGVHTLSMFIAKNSRYVTPVPDARLGYDNAFTLAAEIAAADTTVSVLESTKHMPDYTNYKARHSLTLRIGEELIEYGAPALEPPQGFTSCQRGAYGTTPSAHAAGTKAYQLKACWGMFGPGVESGLYSEIAENIANMINACGFDMVYLDGLDGAQVLEGDEFRWHYGGRFAFEVFERLERPIVMEMAAFLHHLWFVRSRMGAWDNASRGHKHFIDLHCRSNANFHRIFLPGHLGWWAPRVSGGAKEETAYADDAAYLCTKAIADGIGFSLQGVTLDSFRSIPHLRELQSVFKRHEDVRRSGKITDSVRRQLGKIGAEFELDDSDPDNPQFHAVGRHIHHTAQPGADGLRWTVVNEKAAQVPRLRLEAMWSAGDYDCPEGLTLAEFADPDEFTDNGPVHSHLNSGEDFDYGQAAPGMSAQIIPVPGKGPDGGPAGCFTAQRARGAGTVLSSAPDDDFSILHHGERFHRERQASWVRVGKAFEDILDLTELQAMGVWIHGDGKGEWLNLQMRSKGRFFSYSDHYVPIDFAGWKYFELIEPETSRFDACSWPYGRAVYKLHRHGTEYDSVLALHLWLNNVQEGETVEVRLGPVRALPVLKNRLLNPVLTLNDRAVDLPVELESGCRLEVEGVDATVFGRQGERLREFQLPTPLPLLQQGENTVEFACDGALPRPRARISLVTREPEPIILNARGTVPPEQQTYEESGEIVIRDFSNAVPASALSTCAEKGKWRLIDWTSASDSGTLLYSYIDETPEIAVPLEANGFYAISLGLFQPPHRKNRIRVKLSDDEQYAEFYQRQGCQWIPLNPGSYRFEEQFWRFAELKGQHLNIAMTPEGSGLGFIRLIPLDKNQIARLQNPVKTPWLWTIDGHGTFIEELTPASRAVSDPIEAMKGSDFTVLSWGIMGADVTNYETQFGRRHDTREQATSRPIDVAISSNIERCLQEGHDTNQLAVETARKNGFKVYLAQRPQFFTLEPPNDVHGSEFYRQNRHLACETRDGRRLMQLSFAYPEVRNHLIDVLEEMASAKPDGLHLIFNRGIPCSLFEKPVIEEFQAAHGVDPRTLGDLDSRLVEFRYRYITAYLKELRERIGPDLAIAASCFATKRLNAQYGLNIADWAKSGLVQHLLPFRWEWDWDEDYEMGWFNDIARNTSCQIWPFAFTGTRHRGGLPREYRHRALELINAGASGLCGWDAQADLACLRLGHRNELELWEELAVPLLQTDIHTMGGVAVDSAVTPHFCA